MNTLILYYSYTGCSKKQAIQIKEEEPECDIYEVKEKRRLNMFGTFMINCPRAAKRKKVAIQPIEKDLNKYDKYILVAPIWNSYPAPEFNSIVEQLPTGKDVEIYMCSGGGESEKSKAGTCEMIRQAGLNLVDYHDIKTVGMIQKK